MISKEIFERMDILIDGERGRGETRSDFLGDMEVIYLTGFDRARAMHATSDSTGSTNFRSTFLSLIEYTHQQEQRAEVPVRVGGGGRRREWRVCCIYTSL